MSRPKSNRCIMSEKYFNAIYKDLYKQVSKIAYAHYRNRFKQAGYRDFVQVGIIGVLDMREGHPIGMYVNRAQRRMIDYYRYLVNDLRSDRILLNLWEIYGNKGVYADTEIYTLEARGKGEWYEQKICRNRYNTKSLG